jgi:hypothetical protein
MAENNRHLPEKPGEGLADGPGYETGDVNAWAVGKFAIALIAIVALSLGILVGLFKYFQTRDQANPVVETQDPHQLFPEPRLQRTAISDLKAVRAEEEFILNGYGWVDPQRGLVHIPIDVAIDVLARKGLALRVDRRAEVPKQ